MIAAWAAPGLLGLALALGLVLLLRRRQRSSASPTAPAADHDALLARAHAEQEAHEAEHPVAYTPHQRRRALHRRVEEAAHLAGHAPPHDLEHRVRRRVPLKE